MTTTPTTALVEEAEKLSQRATPGPWRVGTVHAAEEVWAAYPDGLAGLASERLLLRLNPNFTSEQDTAFIARARTLVPEFAAALRRAEAELDAATTQLAKKFKRLEELEKRAEKAEAERDAQHAEVLRLTGERDEARAKLAEWQDVGAGFCWFAVCIATNQQAIDRLCQVIGRERLEKIEELESTRDLLTAENARLQKERDAAAASLNALAKGARHVPCFGECASERICIACYGLQNLKGWVEWQKRTETERDEARSELAEARAHIATLELLRRGGK